MSNKDLEIARKVIRDEGKILLDLADQIGESFIKAVELIDQSEGKLVVTGMGKSGIICRKIAATFASTGTPSFFLHPAEGVHGDLGMLSSSDILLAVSNSGETKEVLGIIPTIRRFKIPIIAITASSESSLGRYSQVVIETGRIDEVGTLKLAPTSSTTATLALGDALAITLMERKGFSSEEFALYHPSGSLGRKLLLKVEDLMHSEDDKPVVRPDALMSEAIMEMTAKRLGITGVTDDQGALIGCITDGDLRRGLEKFSDMLTRPVSEIMTPAPKMIPQSELAAEALNRMEKHSITSLFVHGRNEPNKWVGIIHLHDILRAGLA